jgi:hypothetical protein
VWWLMYRHADQIVGIAIVEAPSLYHARMRAAVTGIGKAADYSGGKEIDAAHAGLVPRELIGRLLSPEEAIELTARLTADGGTVGESPPMTASQDAAAGSAEPEANPDDEAQAII